MMGSSAPLEAKALFARMTTPPSNARKAQITRLIRTLKQAGIWTKLDVLYVYAAADSQAALLNWKGATFDATNHGAAFTADRGFTGDGVDDYISTGFYIGSGQTSFADLMFGVSIRTVPTSSWKFAVGTMVTSNYATLQVLPYAISAVISRGVDTNLGVGLSGVGNIQVQKAGGTLTGYRNGLLIGTRTSTLTAGIDKPFFISAANGNGTPSGFFDGRIAAAYFGLSLSAAQAVALDGALQTYFAAVGA
jgi:hypothetical protein